MVIKSANGCKSVDNSNRLNFKPDTIAQKFTPLRLLFIFVLSALGTSSTYNCSRRAGERAPAVPAKKPASLF